MVFDCQWVPIILNFLWMDKPSLFLQSMLDKPNPYLGYTLANIWEHRAAAKNARQHPDFEILVKRAGLVETWGEIRLARPGKTS